MSFTIEEGVVYFVATPIGNLEDITLRALECLRQVSIIACEDTRHSARLLSHYEITTPRISLHQHNEAGRSQHLLNKLREGASVAVISDAGMPAVSDPGERFLQECIRNEVPYDILPGPSSVLNALVGAGFPTAEFFYGGFLPVKKGRRMRALEEALQRPYASVFLESPHRLAATLVQLNELDPARLACVARELTKKFQEYRRAPAKELAEEYQTRKPKGEIVLVISGNKLPNWVSCG